MHSLSSHRRITLSLLCLAAFFLFASSVWGAEYASVKKDGVNIRSGPGTDHEILWEVFAGFPLKVLKRSDDWAEVIDFEGDKGWIYSPLLSKEKMVIVKNDSVNMRSEPSTEGSIIATVKQGVVFKLMETKGDWVRVSYKDDISGWIYRTLLWPSDI